MGVVHQDPPPAMGELREGNAPPMAGTYTGVACCLAIPGWPFFCHVVCG